MNEGLMRKRKLFRFRNDERRFSEEFMGRIIRE